MRQIIIKKPGRAPEVIEAMENVFEQVQGEIGGYITPLKISSICLWHDEDGKMKGLPHNVRTESGSIAGTIVITWSNKSGKAVGFKTPEQVQHILDNIIPIN